MDEPIIKSLRWIVNKGHSAIFNDDAFNDMPNPPFEPDTQVSVEHPEQDYGEMGQSFVISYNSARIQAIDLNFKACTGGADKWSFKYLNGESEYTGTNYGGKSSKFSRGGDWNLDNSKNIAKDETALKMNNHYETYFINNFENKNLIYQRTKTSVSAAWYTAVMDNFNWGNDVTFDPGRRQHANYVPAKGITFRYTIRAKEWYGGIKDAWKVRPINFMAMCYSTGAKGAPVYLAELISFSAEEAAAKNCGSHSPWDIGRKRKVPGKLHYKTDWYYIKENEDGEKYQTMGGAPWNPMGNYKHSENSIVSNSFPEIQNGTVTATLSSKSVKTIMDKGLMCVGIIFGGQCYNGCSYMTESTMTLEIYDTKLLVPEFYGDNNFDIINYADVESPLMARILEEQACCEDAHKNYMAARQSGHLQQLWKAE